MNTIAVDCGASFTKFALFEDSVMTITEQVATPPVREGVSVFCTEKIEALIEIIQQNINKYSSHLREASLCIDNEMHGFVLAYEDGTPYTDYVSWQHELISPDVVRKQLALQAGEETVMEYVKKTGMPLRAGLPSTNLFWMNREGCFNDQSVLYFYTLGDYIVRRITGKAPVCHPTNAAATGLYNLETNSWNKDYISLLTGNANIIFPTIGKDDIRINLDNTEFRVLPAIGDQQAALLGSELNKMNELSFNMGTGAQVSRLIKGNYTYGNYQIRPYFFGYYLKTIPHIPSGRAINVFFRFLKDVYRKADLEIDDETIWNIMSESVSETAMNENALYCDLSFFENAITDHNKGSIENITEFVLNLENLVSGVFAQMIRNFVNVAEKVNEGLPEYCTIVFSGGIAKRWPVLRKGIVKELHSKAEVCISENDALFGCMKYSQMCDGDR